MPESLRWAVRAERRFRAVSSPASGLTRTVQRIDGGVGGDNKPNELRANTREI